ncbi:hypothetical protein OIU78_015380 [Salix suchowensis]|nr:hypothetical protein OIU78_015380 [Salix suchowensis]
MELNKFILLLLISSPLLSFSAEAICVPRNASNHEATRPAVVLGRASSFSSPPPVPSPSPPVSREPSPSILPSPSNSYALTKICGFTDHPAECIAAISPFLTGKTDPISVLQIGNASPPPNFRGGHCRCHKTKQGSLFIGRGQGLPGHVPGFF